jgi:type III pantothenate kinase
MVAETSASIAYYRCDASTPLPIKVDVQFPEKVGRDRLLNALAVETVPAFIISAGSAVTVDAVDSTSTFLGGAIFPGLRLMAKALNDYTARLPLIDGRPTSPPLPGKNTEQAMHAGIVHAVVGGIVRCVEEMIRLSQVRATIYLTGGDASSLQPHLPWQVEMAPTLALQGIIIASRTLWS